MKSRERVRRAFHFNQPDKVPMSCISLKTDFFPVSPTEPQSWQPTDLPPHVRGGVNTISKWYYRWFIYNWDKEIRKKLGYPRDWWKYPHESVDEWGVIWKNSGTASDDITKGHPFHGPLQDSWDALKEYKPPNASDPERYRLVKSRIMKFIGRNKYTIGSMGVNGFFNLCSQLRGFNNLLVDVARNAEKVNSLIEKVLPFYITQIKKLKEYFPKLDSIMIPDDMGTQRSPFISPRIFRKIFKEPYKKIISLTHDLDMDFILHSCGQIYELMPDIIEAGVDVFEFDSPHMVGIENIKKFADKRQVAFWLSSNIQSTYVNGTPADVEQEIKNYIKNVGNNQGGLAIYEYTSNNTLGTPKENIKAQRQATEKWGQYDENGMIEWLS
ncbi:MAG: uroporphyrinogen decarboxylase family protein [Promethearchaeia archaeon]